MEPDDAKEIIKQIVDRIDYLIDCGKPCPLCDHHYIHEEDCPYLECKEALEG